MDLVALRFHDKCISNVFPTAPAFMVAEYSQGLAKIVRSQWRDLEEPHLTTRPARCRGWAAASWMIENMSFMAQQAGRDPNAVFERLSIQLNCIDTTVDARQAFVAQINGLATEVRSGHASKGLRRLNSLIDDWMAGRATPEEIYHGVLSFR